MRTTFTIAAASLVMAGAGLMLTAPTTAAQGLDAYETAFSTQSTARSPYVRFELGGQAPSLANAFWRPPGWEPNPPPGDPEVSFDLDGDTTGYAAIAFGYDWMNGIRTDISLGVTGDIAFSGPCAAASDNSPCSEHADITDGSVRSVALMGNIFYSPLEASGSDAGFQPYIVAGLGLSRNTMDSWTRFNTEAEGPETRVFGSNSETGFAWSLGIGASWQLSQPGERPILLDISWRYYDFGEAVGSGIGTPGGPGSIPQQPLTFDLTTQIFTIGLRMPL